MKKRALFALILGLLILVSITFIFNMNYVGASAFGCTNSCGADEVQWPDCSCHAITSTGTTDVYTLCIESGYPQACCGSPGQDNSAARDSPECEAALTGDTGTAGGAGTSTNNQATTQSEALLQERNDKIIACFHGSTVCTECANGYVGNDNILRGNIAAYGHLWCDNCVKTGQTGCKCEQSEYNSDVSCAEAVISQYANMQTAAGEGSQAQQTSQTQNQNNINPGTTASSGKSTTPQQTSQTEVQQKIAEFRQQLSNVINDYENQADSLPRRPAIDQLGRIISPETLKQGINESLPVVTLQFDVRNANTGKAVSAIMPDGTTLNKVVAIPARNMYDSEITVTVTDGKTWMLQQQAKGKPDYPLPDEEVAKIINIETIEKGQKVKNAYSQAMLEYTMPLGTYAYSESKYPVTPEALQAQQDFFKSLEILSNSKQYHFPSNLPVSSSASNTGVGYLLESLWNQAELSDYKNMGDSVGQYIFVRYDEARGTWTQLPNRQVECAYGVCRYIAISPGTSTFAILQVKKSVSPLNSPLWIIIGVGVIVLVGIYFLIRWANSSSKEESK